MDRSVVRDDHAAAPERPVADVARVADLFFLQLVVDIGVMGGQLTVMVEDQAADVACMITTVVLRHVDLKEKKEYVFYLVGS